MIYNFNYTIRRVNSGVEHAEAYRSKCFKKLNVDYRIVYLDFIYDNYILQYTNNLGLDQSKLIWIYLYFTNLNIKPLNIKIEDFKNNFNNDTYKISKTPYGYIFRFNKNDFIKVFIVDDKYVYKAIYCSNSYIVKVDYFSYTKMYTEYYKNINDKKTVFQRVFYNEDGSVAYEQFLYEGKEYFKFENNWLCSKQEFIAEFLKKLNLSKNDVILADRNLYYGQVFLENKGDAKIGIVVHAEHFCKSQIDDNYIFWNYYYEYPFMHNKYIDFYLVSTDEQRRMLLNHFKKCKCDTTKIYTIPVASHSELHKPTKPRKKFAMITASRLANEKHVELIIHATKIAKDKIPELSLDIYGDGQLKKALQEQIESLNASDYIKLKGQKHVLDDVYCNYEAYLCGSKSECFGISLFEAIGSGLPIIGFDVRYGIKRFVKNKKNGYLVKINDLDSNSELIAKLADAIVDYFSLDDRQSYIKESYKIASEFLDDKIIVKWKKLLDDCND